MSAAATRADPAADPAGDRGLLRVQGGHGHHRVSFVELFFDLVFVFAVTQISHTLTRTSRSRACCRRWY